jgi:hypothetical protein
LRRGGLELAHVEVDERVAGHERVAVAQPVAGNLPAVDVRAVAAAEVDDRPPAAGGLEPAVVAREADVVDSDVAVRGPADHQRAVQRPAAHFLAADGVNDECHGVARSRERRGKQGHPSWLSNRDNPGRQFSGR